MYKIALVTLLLISYCLTSVGQVLLKDRGQSLQLQPKVDQRVELLSIIFRLAGNSEFNQEQHKAYVQVINNHFELYKTHPAVVYARKLAVENSIGYDAVMSMAVHLTDPPLLEPVIPFSATVPESRWGAVKANEFALLLQQFYREAECASFFARNQPLYQVAVENFKQVLKQVDLTWYKAYYGKAPQGAFRVVLGLGNGGGNYGPKVVFPSGQEEIYAIIGTWKTDSWGKPVYTDREVLPIIIHEFNHSFVNSLIDLNKLGLQTAGEKIFPLVEQQMLSQAYGNWKTMMYEALVRASVIRYMLRQKMNSSSADELMRNESQRGFFWMNELVELLGKYEEDRQKYPTLERFMPQIIVFYNRVATNLKSKH